jgi:hypothetical protein
MVTCPKLIAIVMIVIHFPLILDGVISAQIVAPIGPKNPIKTAQATRKKIRISILGLKDYNPPINTTIELLIMIGYFLPF